MNTKLANGPPKTRPRPLARALAQLADKVTTALSGLEGLLRSGATFEQRPHLCPHGRENMPLSRFFAPVAPEMMTEDTSSKGSGEVG